MAVTDPRAALSAAAYDGMHGEYTTFTIDASTITYSATTVGGSAAVGKAVTLSAGMTVALAGDGEAVIGKLILVEADGKCNVQTDGKMTLPGGNGAALTLGKKIVGALNASSAKGYIREVATATAAELGRAEGAILDATDTANVLVDL